MLTETAKNYQAVLETRWADEWRGIAESTFMGTLIQFVLCIPEWCVWCVNACACVFTCVWAHICTYKCMWRPTGRCWKSSSIAFWRWDYRWAAMSTWHFCALWRSKLWFSTLCSSHFSCCALSPALLGHLFSLIVNSPFLLLLPWVVFVMHNGKKNLIYFLFLKKFLIAFPWICKVVMMISFRAPWQQV